MIKVTVDRAKWYRGEGPDLSRLLRGDGKMCCIGFLGKAMGIPDDAMIGVETLYGTTIPEACAFSDQYRDALIDAYDVNDKKGMKAAEREQKLKRLGKKMGVAFTFVTPRKKKRSTK
jgi:hypothetical protein